MENNNFTKIVIPKSKDVLDELIKNNFEKRTGSAGYDRPNLFIDLEKKWYWETNDKIEILKNTTK